MGSSTKKFTIYLLAVGIEGKNTLGGGGAHWVSEWMLLRDARSADFSLAKKLQLEDKNSLRNFLVMDKKVL